jgi:hypothetical protein
MHKMRKYQKYNKGFTVVEVLLLLLVCSVIGFGSFYVYKSNSSNKSATPSSSNKGSSATVSTQNASPAPPKTPVGFNVQELGIKIINQPTKLSDLTYTVTPPSTRSPFTQATFTTTSLTKINPNCDIGVLNRYSGTYDATRDEGALTFLKQFNGYWIAKIHIGTQCTEDEPASSAQANQVGAFSDWVKDANNIQSIE